jgi:hypothetical protein
VEARLCVHARGRVRTVGGVSEQGRVSRDSSSRQRFERALHARRRQDGRRGRASPVDAGQPHRPCQQHRSLKRKDFAAMGNRSSGPAPRLDWIRVATGNCDIVHSSCGPAGTSTFRLLTNCTFSRTRVKYLTVGLAQHQRQNKPAGSAEGTRPRAGELKTHC